jgi:hypothetical protein
VENLQIKEKRQTRWHPLLGHKPHHGFGYLDIVRMRVNPVGIIYFGKVSSGLGLMDFVTFSFMFLLIVDIGFL